MTYVKCGMCKKEYPMKDLKLDKSQNFMLCSNCYSSVQSKINEGMSKSKSYDDYDDFDEPKEKKQSIFSKITGFFSGGKKKEEPKNNPIKMGEDINVKRNGPIITKDEPMLKRAKSVPTEEKIKYLCNKCFYKFQLKQNTRIKLCPMCGSKEIEQIKDMDADSILRSVDEMR